MRAFIALELPEEFESQVAGIARQLSAAVEGRFMHRETYHITLAFLGDVDEAAVSDAMSAMDEACEERSAVLLSPDGLGKFGRASDATLWLGLDRNEGLMGLAESMRSALAEHSVGFDAKPFKPHITLARRAHVRKGGLPALAFPNDALASRVTLFKSTLSKEGASYKELYSADL